MEFQLRDGVFAVPQNSVWSIRARRYRNPILKEPVWNVKVSLSLSLKLRSDSRTSGYSFLHEWNFVFKMPEYQIEYDIFSGK